MVLLLVSGLNEFAYVLAGLNICAHYHILFIVVLVSASLKVDV